MPAPPSPETRAQIRAGIGDCATVGLGLIPLGLAFGVLLTQSGYSWWWAPLFSTLIYAGSMEFLAIGLFAAATPLYGLAMAAFLVNFRHVFYGLSFPLDRVRGPLARTYAVYALTDETYAIVSARGPRRISGVRAVTIAACCQVLWVVPGIVGALVGAALPPGLEGLQFALTALFAVLALDAWRGTGDVPGPVLALGCALIAHWIAPGQMLVVGLGLFVAGLIVRYLVLQARGGAMPGDAAGDDEAGAGTAAGDDEAGDGDATGADAVGDGLATGADDAGDAAGETGTVPGSSTKTPGDSPTPGDPR